VPYGGTLVTGCRSKNFWRRVEEHPLDALRTLIRDIKAGKVDHLL
jgi:hypothetical protein